MTGFLLDTNVPSEVGRPRPDAKVQQWIKAQVATDLFISVISLGELRVGFELLPLDIRRLRMQQWFLSEVVPMFQGRIVPVTQTIAERWGTLEAQSRKDGTNLGMADGLIAATALVHDLTLVTRNVKDFESLGLTLLNPWEL